MDDNIIVEYKGDYVHARHSGPNSYDSSLELWKRIVAACEEHRCCNVLGESFDTNSLSTMEAYDHIRIFKIAGVTREYRIAWVNHIKETQEIMKFIENVLVNRGLAQGGLFPTVDEAKRWLLGDSASNGSDADDGE